MQGVDAESGIAALYVNGNEFTELTNNTLNVRLQKADTSYEYFTLQAKDKAGNMSEIYKVGNPYYENPDAVKENTEAVSYTHLDVYKRQGNGEVLEIIM